MLYRPSTVENWRLSVKVGDMVKFNANQMWAPIGWRGIIIEVGVYVGRRDVKVLARNGKTQTHKSRELEVISESR